MKRHDVRGVTASKDFRRCRSSACALFSNHNEALALVIVVITRARLVLRFLIGGMRSNGDTSRSTISGYSSVNGTTNSSSICWVCNNGCYNSRVIHAIIPVIPLR